MRARLLLRRGKTVIVSRLVNTPTMQAFAGEAGQAAWQMFVEARRLGEDLIGLSLDVVGDGDDRSGAPSRSRDRD